MTAPAQGAASDQLTVTGPDGDGVLTIAGEVDEAVVGVLQHALTSPTLTAVDMSQVTFMNSTGVRLLLEAHRRVGRLGRRLEVRNPSRSVRRVLELTGLSDVFQLGDDHS